MALASMLPAESDFVQRVRIHTMGLPPSAGACGNGYIETNPPIPFQRPPAKPRRSMLVQAPDGLWGGASNEWRELSAPEAEICP